MNNQNKIEGFEVLANSKSNRIIDLHLKDEFIETFPYCWNGLNKKLSGIRLGELNLLTGGTGTGKSQVCREFAYHLISKKHKVVGRGGIPGK